MKVDGIKILVSQAAIVGIGLLWYNFNRTVFYAVRDIIEKTYNEMKDLPVESERYPAEEPGFEEDSEEPVSDEDAEEPVSEEDAEEPVSEEDAEEPVSDEDAENKFSLSISINARQQARSNSATVDA